MGIVLAAGFIGYFGRYLAMLIIDRSRKTKTESPPQQTLPNPEVQLEERRLKVEKKKEKTEVKKAKKGTN